MAVRAPQQQELFSEVNEQKDQDEESFWYLEYAVRAMSDPHVAEAIKFVQEMSNRWTLFDNNYVKVYVTWFDKSVESLKGMLENNFPGRWEIENVDPDTRILESVRYNRGNLIQLRQLQTLTVRIHFPIIVISNSTGNSWTIRDLYVILKLGGNLGVIDLCGFRATRTPLEWREIYSHSHLTRHDYGSYGEFCLGSSELDILVGELKTSTFDEIKMELFFQNLTDYLSWESVEGVPYYSIDALVAGGKGADTRPVMLSSEQCNSLYRSFLATRPQLKLHITHANIPGKEKEVKVIKDVSLFRAITRCASGISLYPLQDGTLTSIYPITPISDRDIRTHNENSVIMFNFKGEPVRSIIIEEEKEEKNEGIVELFVDSRVVDWMLIILEAALSSHLLSEFRYGTKRTEDSIPQV